MNGDPGRVVPFRFDLSELVGKSVATLYSHLVTRPTGKALRLGIESQVGEIGVLCISVLDFSQVVVLDYSCADETVAKLVLRFQRPDRPADAYFIARGVGGEHRETIEAVLERQGLTLVVEMDGEAGRTLLGATTPLERACWSALERLRRARPAEIAAELSAPAAEIDDALERLAARRVVLHRGAPRTYFALGSLAQR